jgi:hypothetical protein
MRKTLNTAVAKIRSPSLLPQTKDQERKRLTQSMAFTGLQDAVNLFQEVAGTAGVPGLQEGAKCLSILLDAIKVYRELSFGITN